LSLAQQIDWAYLDKGWGLNGAFTLSLTTAENRRSRFPGGQFAPQAIGFRLGDPETNHPKTLEASPTVKASRERPGSAAVGYAEDQPARVAQQWRQGDRAGSDREPDHGLPFVILRWSDKTNDRPP
jgi:hypothetical protein